MGLFFRYQGCLIQLFHFELQNTLRSQLLHLRCGNVAL